MDIKIIKVSGNPTERSKSYAEQLRTRIQQTYDFYNDVVFKHSELSDVEIYKRVNILISKTRAVFPNLISELECISESSNIPIQQIFLINARTEILNASVGECTSIAIPKNNLLAQTWDWIEEMENLMVILIVEKEDGSSFVTLTEPGMLAKNWYKQLRYQCWVKFFEVKTFAGRRACTLAATRDPGLYFTEES